MNFIDFCRAEARVDTPAGAVARAIVHEHDIEFLPAFNLERELRDESTCEGTYHGIKALWTLWESAKNQRT